MNKIRWTLLPLLAGLIAGCASLAAPAGSTPAAPVTPSPSPSSPGIVSASAIVVPAQTSRLGFLISARIKEVDIKEGDQVQAGQTLVVLDTPDLNTAVTAAQASVDAAQADANLQRYRRKVTFFGKTWYLSGPPERIAKADAVVQQAQAALEVAQANLAQGILKAPYSGTVIELDAVPGELVQPGQVVAVIGDLSHLQIETTDLSERQISRIKIGQSAVVHVKALNQDSPGKISAISPMAVRKDNDLVFKVTIQLEAQDARLLWGMSADVEIQTGE